MKQVRISDLKSHLSEHLRSAEAGEVIEVLDRARPIVHVVPIETAEPGLDVIPARRSFASVRRMRLPPATLATTSLSALRHERGHR